MGEKCNYMDETLMMWLKKKTMFGKESIYSNRRLLRIHNIGTDYCIWDFISRGKLSKQNPPQQDAGSIQRLKRCPVCLRLLWRRNFTHLFIRILKTIYNV